MKGEDGLDLDRRIIELEEQIRHHNYLYYTQGSERVSDAEYDALKEELEMLDPDNPVLQMVGWEPRFGTSKIRHKVEMRSLDKAYNYEDIISWAGDEAEFVTQPKLDGLAVSIYYEKGVFRYAATRGDGKVGEDITENARYIEDIPKHLCKDVTCHIRGEIFMTLSVFKSHAGVFSNPRNAAAGSVKQKDPEVTGERQLNFRAYTMEIEPMERSSLIGELKFESQLMRLVDKLGCKPVDYQKCSLQDLEAIFTCWDDGRGELDYEIDGMVIKFNSLHRQKEIGATSHHPRWAIAWKFRAQQAETTVEDIRWQISRRGYLTPVADLETVRLAGANISHSTLHNVEELDRLGLNIGDRVLIERRGDVIPKIIRVIGKGERKGVVPAPEECPRCHSPVVRENMFLKCTNPNCSQRILRQLTHFAEVADIDSLGPKMIKKLYDRGMVASPSDLYKLRSPDLLTLDKVGDVLAGKIIDNIRSSRRFSLTRFLTALGITHLGGVISELLAEKFRDMESIREATMEELQSIDGVGEKIAESVKKELEEMWPVIEELKDAGVEIFPDEKSQTGKDDYPLEGMTFCITGTLSRPRKEIADDIKRAGGYVKGMSKSIDYLVAGDHAGTKIDKAKNWDVKIIDEYELDEMLSKNWNNVKTNYQTKLFQ